MKFRHSISAAVLAIAAQSAFGEVINIPQASLLPLGDPGQVSWVAGDAGLIGPTNVKLIAEITGTAIANSFVIDIQNNGFPAPPIGGSSDDLVVFGPAEVPGALATVDFPPAAGLALFHDVFDETGVFLSGPDGILDDNGVNARDAYLCSDTSKNYTAEGRRQLVKYYLVNPAHSYQFTSQWGTVTQLGSGYRAFIFLDDDHSPNYDYDDLIVGVLPPPCTDNAACDDGDLCNGVETCLEGVCLEGQTVICDDGNVCNGVESCVQGVCQNGTPPNCDDGVACTADSCDSAGCVHVPDDASCPDDLLFCTGTEWCNSDLGCTSMGSPCNVGQVCDEELNVCRACENDADCDDANPCTLGHACVEGACAPAVPVNCAEAGSQCVAASCDPAGEAGNCDVLTPAPGGTPCDDGLFCTFPDTCLAGVCQGSARDCSSLGDQCNSASCDEEINACQVQPVGDETACNDGDPCTVGDACQAGVCHGLTAYGLEQWSALAECLLGPSEAVSQECACGDLNDDGHVDLLDAAEFQILSDTP